MISSITSEAEASHPPWVPPSRVVWRAVRGTIPALPLDLYRIASGALFFAEGFQSLVRHWHASSFEVAGGLAKTISGALIVAGVWPRLSASALLVTLAWMSRGMAAGSIDDYLAASTCFWLACLPVGRTIRFPLCREALVQARRQPVSDFSRRVFVLWIASLCFFGVLCDAAWGAWLPPRVSRTLTGLLLASLLWPPRSLVRCGGALLFGALVFGLFVRVGPSPGVLLLLFASLLVWAPELGGRAATGKLTNDEEKGVLDVWGVLSAAMFVLFALSILPWATGPARKSAAILRDVGLTPDFTWRDRTR